MAEEVTQLVVCQSLHFGTVLWWQRVMPIQALHGGGQW